jgi:hypothetical protein
MYQYQRGDKAAIWQDDPPAVSSPRNVRPPIKTIWATKAWRTAQGRCVGVRLVGGQVVQVCVSTGQTRKWVPAERVLTAKQAKAWASTGFTA